MKKKFRSLELTVKKLVNSFGAGSHLSLLKDSTIDVDVSRAYQPGDKKLDSRSSLRSQQTMSRSFTPEKELTIFLVLDVSASQYSKLEHSISVCLYMSYLANLSNDKVGLITFSDKMHECIQPCSDERNITPALERIYLAKMEGKTNLESPLNYLNGLALTNTLFLFVSDFCYAITERAGLLLKSLTFGTGNAILSLAMIDPNEWKMEKRPFSVNFQDAESTKSSFWNFSKNSSNHFQDWQSELNLRLRQARTIPIMMSIHHENYLMPLIKHFLKA